MVNKLDYKYECPIEFYIFKFIDSHIHIFYKLGMTPNMLTTLSIIFGLLAASQIMKNRLWLASIFWLIAYYFDCVDGKFARKYNMVTKFGDIYDHIGDMFKVIAVLIALFYSNKEKTSVRQWIYICIILFLGILQILHMGYQESIYNKKDESPYLNIIRSLFVNEENAKHIIHYTKHFGCGTWFLCFSILIILWR